MTVEVKDMMTNIGKGPKVTCPDCGLEYIDDTDWSGPAHNWNDCVKVLKARVQELKSAIDSYLEAQSIVAAAHADLQSARWKKP